MIRSLANKSSLVRQNAILFTGGLIAGVGGFVFHAIAGRVLGPTLYGQLAALIAIYVVGTGPAVILSTVLARYTASLAAQGGAGVSSLMFGVTRVVAVAGLAALLLVVLLAHSVASFDHLTSVAPVVLVGLAIALVWQVAIARGVLQGLQRFAALAANLSLELIVRTATALGLLVAGYAIAGAAAALIAGLAVCFAVGQFSLRDMLRSARTRVRLRIMAGYSLTAAAGIVGIQILYNQDVILAQHFLRGHDGGIYGGLNKIGSIVFYLTLSVSQVLFPRVVEAIARRQHPGRILLMSAGILTTLGTVALIVFAVAPNLVVNSLFGAGFHDATPYVLAVGVLGLALSLDNLLIQFFMAVHDRVFIPILATSCVSEGLLISVFHAGVGQVIADVGAASVGLLLLLSIRCYLLMLTLSGGDTGDGGKTPSLGAIIP